MHVVVRMMQTLTERLVTWRGASTLWLEPDTFADVLRAADPFIGDARCPETAHVVHVRLADAIHYVDDGARVEVA